MSKNTLTLSGNQAHKGRLRILATTDLHMQLMNYDYFADQHDESIGLIGLADHIDRLRTQRDVTTLLFDNGDLIQGNPLGDYIAKNLGPRETHPMVAALNALKYDAITLGNHEFDYGLTYLRQTLENCSFPVVSANISSMQGPALTQPFVILERTIKCDDGTIRPLKVGVTGFGPPQITDWDSTNRNNEIKAEDIIMAARNVIPQMQTAGADLIVALCHSGIKAQHHTPRMENAAVPLAQVDGIDVILTGHTHEAFPDPNIAATSVVDYVKGTVHGKPCVMAGYCGKSLGVIDLQVHWMAGRWKIKGHSINLEPATASSTQSPRRRQLRALVAKPHAAVIAQMQKPIAKTAISIHSYFATILPDLSQQLLARATQQAVQTALRESSHNKLPVLAAKSSFRFGGRSGLGHYIDIPVGEITLRDAAAIFPFADTLCAVRRTGADIKRWLERSAAHYNQIHQGRQDQQLINPKSAGYNCDTIFGITYEIDLGQPARFTTDGQEVAPDACRINNLRYKGHPVSDDDVFVVATNSFRASGGGGFPHIAAQDILHRVARPIREILIDYLKHEGNITQEVQSTWSFAPVAQASGAFESAPCARAHMAAPISYLGAGHAGFDSYRITF
jgi:2',3'-cyclic-nucleotide 2'-phosphodiesterase/3'-nucleotidase